MWTCSLAKQTCSWRSVSTTGLLVLNSYVPEVCDLLDEHWEKNVQRENISTSINHQCNNKCWSKFYWQDYWWVLSDLHNQLGQSYNENPAQWAHQKWWKVSSSLNYLTTLFSTNQYKSVAEWTRPCWGMRGGNVSRLACVFSLFDNSRNNGQAFWGDVARRLYYCYNLCSCARPAHVAESGPRAQIPMLQKAWKSDVYVKL